MERKLIDKIEYADDKGFAIFVCDAPEDAETKADTIKLLTIKDGNSYSSYYTPDEAMSVAMGLLRAIDAHLFDWYREYRDKKDSPEREPGGIVNGLVSD